MPSSRSATARIPDLGLVCVPIWSAVARTNGASINAAAKTSGINYRTAQPIVEAAAAYRPRQFAAVG